MESQDNMISDVIKDPEEIKYAQEIYDRMFFDLDSVQNQFKHDVMNPTDITKSVTRVQTTQKQEFQLQLTRNFSETQSEDFLFNQVQDQDQKQLLSSPSKKIKDENNWWDYLKPHILFLRKLLAKSLDDEYVSDNDFNTVLSYGSEGTIYHSQNIRLLLIKKSIKNGQQLWKKIKGIIYFILCKKINSIHGIYGDLFSLPLSSLVFQSTIFSIQILAQMVKKGTQIEIDDKKYQDETLKFFFQKNSQMKVNKKMVQKFQSYKISNIIMLVYELVKTKSAKFNIKQVKNFHKFIQILNKQIDLMPQSSIALQFISLKYGIKPSKYQLKLKEKLLYEQRFHHEYFSKHKANSLNQQFEKENSYSEFNTALGAFQKMQNRVAVEKKNLSKQQSRYIISLFKPRYRLTQTTDYNFWIIRIFEIIFYNGFSLTNQIWKDLNQLVKKIKEEDLKNYLIWVLHMHSFGREQLSIQRKEEIKYLDNLKKLTIIYLCEYIRDYGIEEIDSNKLVQVGQNIMQKSEDSELANCAYKLIMEILTRNKNFSLQIVEKKQIIQSQDFQSLPHKILNLSLLLHQNISLKMETIDRVYKIFCKSQVFTECYSWAKKVLQEASSKQKQQFSDFVLKKIQQSVENTQKIGSNLQNMIKDYTFALKLCINLIKNKKYKEIEANQISKNLLEQIIQNKIEKTNLDSWALRQILDKYQIFVQENDIKKILQTMKNKKISRQAFTNLEYVLLKIVKQGTLLSASVIQQMILILKKQSSPVILESISLALQNQKQQIYIEIIQQFISMTRSEVKSVRSDSHYLLMKVIENKNKKFNYLKIVLQFFKQQISMEINFYTKYQLIWLKQMGEKYQLTPSILKTLKQLLMERNSFPQQIKILIVQIFSNQLKFGLQKTIGYQDFLKFSNLSQTSIPFKTQILEFWYHYSSCTNSKLTKDLEKLLLDILSSSELLHRRLTIVILSRFQRINLTNQCVQKIVNLINEDICCSSLIFEILCLVEKNQQNFNSSSLIQIEKFIEKNLDVNNEEVLKKYLNLLEIGKIKLHSVSILVDSLLILQKEELKQKIVEILSKEKLSHNQQKIFQMQKNSLEYIKLNQEINIQEILNLLGEGIPLTITGVSVLQILYKKKSKYLLKILDQIMNNKQQVPNQIINILIKMLEDELEKKNSGSIFRVFRYLKEILIQNGQIQGLLELTSKSVSLGFQNKDTKIIEQIYEERKLRFKSQKKLQLKNQRKTYRKQKLFKQILEEVGEKNQKIDKEKIYEIMCKKQDLNQVCKQWSEVQYKKWASQQKKIKEWDFTVQFIAFLLQVLSAAYHFCQKKKNKNRKLRLNQQIAFILFCLNFKNQVFQNRVVMQIATGEGKSTIISLLAVLVCLMGYRADVITSQGQLASRDSHQKESFYLLFGLRTRHIAVDFKNIFIFKSRIKSCYEADIVYGTLNNFKFDYLQYMFRGIKIRENRQFTKSFAFADEVDNMFIDNRFTYAILSSQSYGTLSFSSIFIYLWVALIQFYKQVSKKKDLQKKQKISIIQEMMNLIGQQIIKSIKQNKPCSLEQENKVQFKVLPHFIEYVEIKMPLWIKSAIEALFIYRKDKQYLIKNDYGGVKRIVPIDFDNNGQIQDNTLWGNGLHQFLQIKQGLKLVPESFTTNYLSNRAFFSLYNKNIFGATGTVGSQASEFYFKKCYDVNILKLPKSHFDTLKQIPTILAKNTQNWSRSIEKIALNMTKNDRGLLILCETKQYAQKLQRILTVKVKQANIYLYTRNDNSQKFSINNTVKKGTIIIATNLAGRGTDLKISKDVQKKGGLHVIVTFLPKNIRVLLQNFGRAARQGQLGSAQLIINYQDLPLSYQGLSIDQMKKLKQKQQKQFLLHYIQNEQRVVKIKDELFKKYCIKISQFREKKTKDRLDELKLQIKLIAVQQSWGLFLNSLKFDNQRLIYEAQLKFNTFMKSLEQKFQNQSVIVNPYLFILLGNKTHQKSKWALTNKQKYSQQIEQSYNLAAKYEYTWIASYKKIQNMIKSKKINSQILKQMKIAQVLLQNQLSSQSSLFMSVSILHGSETDCDLVKQMRTTLMILQSGAKSIQSNINWIKKSMKIIELQNGSKNITSESIEQINSQVKKISTYFKDSIRDHIQKKIQNTFRQSNKIKKLLMVDKKLGNKQNYNLIIKILQQQLSNASSSTANKIMKQITQSVLSTNCIGNNGWVNIFQKIFGGVNLLTKFIYIGQIVDAAQKRINQIELSSQNIFAENVEDKIQSLIVFSSQMLTKSLLEIIKIQIIQPISCYHACKFVPDVMNKLRCKLQKSYGIKGIKSGQLSGLDVPIEKPDLGLKSFLNKLLALLYALKNILILIIIVLFFLDGILKIEMPFT